MRIAIWSDTFPPQVNGAASVVRDLAAAYVSLGHEVAVFSVIDKEQAKQAGATSFPVHKLPSFSVPKFIYPSKELSIALLPGPGTMRILRQFKPDIIHAHTPFSAGWGAVIGKKMLGIPLVGTHHTFFEDYLKYVKLDHRIGQSFSWKYMVAYYNRADAVTTPSRALGEALVNHGLKAPISIIPNPADTEFFIPPTLEEKCALKKKYGLGKQSIVYMGRVSYEKDIDQALTAFDLVKHEFPDATFMIVGDGPERKNLTKQAQRQGIIDHVIFTGMLRGIDLRNALAANDLFVTASRSENMPISIIEAMACGLPIVSVRAKGIPDIVRDGVNGILAEPDRPDLLAHAIITIFKSPKEFEQKAAASCELSHQYSKKHIGTTMLAFYEEVIARSKNKKKKE